ncbi:MULTISPECIES: T9SS type A sorting domain-containing protein [unclassified Polaribacter]|uniref:T9SS type A sorting domain-containing protein n=1 Tax=unclassified Polaribacter TaxID=196858 RepID=UPI0011BE66DE|nr:MULTISPECIES: T9SS type A sorting domain-containing protein [unclassified Polaribacter]TXD49568.1 T9SS type A sorting domain-containing protein [Polaribacter sp. IC063]TXD56206.1 T9SS type A sorting domain-containing protein [Polaribacter sp. IC066]
MKKKYNLFFLAMALLLANQLQAQELHIVEGGSLFVLPNNALYVNNNLSVSGTGVVTISSNATNSGSLIVSGTAAGNITYIKYIPSDTWYLVSAPVMTQDIGAFVVNEANAIRESNTNNYGVSRYNNENPSGSRWEYYTSTAGPLAASSAGNFMNGIGYSNLRVEAGNYTFNGALASADVTVTLPASTNHRWSVVGNPYPSFMPANIKANDTNNILNQNINNLDTGFEALYFWDGITYKPFNHSSDALNLTPGQAFVIRTKSNDLDFTFPKNLQREQVAEAVTLYKRADTPEITLSLQSGSNTTTTNIKYLQNATKGLDVGYDAGTYQEGSAVLAIDTHLVADSKGTNFTLQCLPNKEYETSIVPLSIKAPANESISFSAEAIHLPSDVKVFLEDKEAQTYTDITTSAYQVTSKKAFNGIGRFYIHTSNKNVLNTEDAAIVSTINMYKTSNTNLRVAGSQQKGSATLKMYTLLGKEVLSYNFEMATVNDIPLPQNLATGIYVVQLMANGTKQTKKLRIQ